MVNRQDDELQRNIQKSRKEYGCRIIADGSLSTSPMEQFQTWFQEAIDSGLEEPNALALATSDQKAVSVRYVLMKHFDQSGLVFYTNYQSRKSIQLSSNSLAAGVFYWREFERQVRIEGKVSKVSVEESDEYFRTRPRDAQLGAWASEQSQDLKSRAVLDQRLNMLVEKFRDQEIPRPEHWGGFRIKPIRFEFWQGRENRLHDRFVYKKTSEGWNCSRLYP